MNAPAANVVCVALGERGYDIEIGAGTLPSVGGRVAKIVDAPHAVVVTDTNVEATHAATVAESLRRANVRVDVLSVEPGEKSKSVERADALWRELLKRGADRNTVVVAVGGGVVGDLAGFVAATYARGIPLVQIPTTLVAQVDSSVGGKVGVNLPDAKNMVGAFWQPAAVLIDTDVLATLPLREYRAGLAEVVKYGAALDADLFADLETSTKQIAARDSSVLPLIVARCCRLKADVVEQDERELTGRRAVLNYGHTFAHAIEAVGGYGELLHGEAVAIGMICASRLAQRLGRIDEQVTQRQHDLLAALGLPVAVPKMSSQRLIEAMRRDKKARQGKLNFVLPTELGHVELVAEVSEQLVREVLLESTAA
jgi:3-dehydroquinate synthase